MTRITVCPILCRTEQTPVHAVMKRVAVLISGRFCTIVWGSFSNPLASPRSDHAGEGRICEETNLNLILLVPEDFIAEDRVELTGRRLSHVLEIHRASIGDELRVGLVNNRIGTGTITGLGESALEMEVLLDQPAPPALPLTLILALPRPKVLRRVLRSVSALGVKKIILLHCSRVEKSFWQSPFLLPEAVREQLILGLEQARDTVLPEVLLRPLFKPFVEDELPGLVQGTLPLAAHPQASESCPRNVNERVTLVVGPEGGFIPYEVEKLVAAGCRAVSAGERILSVETAVPVLIARLF